MVEVSPELLTHARRGSFDALEVLASLTSEGYTVAILDVALTHLRLENLPNKFAKDANLLLRVDRAWLSIGIVHGCIRACSDNVSLKDATAARIADQLDGIMSWIHFTFAARGVIGDHRSDDCHLIGLFLGLLLQLHETLRASLVFSKRTIDVLFSIHTFRLVNEVSSCRTREDGHPCYVVTSLWDFIKDNDGLRSVVERLLSSHKLRTKFCEELLFKFTEQSDLSRYKGASQWARSRLYTLVMCCSRLSEHPEVEAELVKAGFLRRVREALSQVPKAVKMKDLFTVVYPTLSRPRLPGQLASFSRLRLCGVDDRYHHTGKLEGEGYNCKKHGTRTSTSTNWCIYPQMPDETTSGLITDAVPS
ncbi:hypothetical protein BKA70DRAFT_684059 [Coprinopsis sp. MPI-PUGE-AT-0042]|nr:hypothetical protein BKA70DRAFT_684059 [Coprinopsis sp. MPI-PUGE-AT-0042]